MFIEAGDSTRPGGEAEVRFAGRSTLPCAPGTIAVFEAPEAGEALCRGLRRMNYPAIRAESWSDLQRTMGNRRPVAAVIGDTMADPFATAALLPADLPKILISADRSLPVRREVLRTGIDALLPRPYDLSELLDWLEQFSPAAGVTPASVLVVDDDPVHAADMATLLEGAGLKVTLASDPSEAISALDDGVIDLVLTDINMPDVDGIALARMIRQNRRTLSVPFLFLSAETDPERHLAAARYSGGGDVIAKPVAPDRLVALVRLRAERARALRAMIERDSLTGLLRHGHFMAQAAEALAHHRRLGTSCSLAMVDIDHFKAINDRFGHPAGDQVIRTLARSLVAHTRPCDVVGRCGGEEFGLLLVGSSTIEARAVLDRIRAGFAAVTFGEGTQHFAATVSAGVAAGAQADLPTLLSSADTALYAAKLAGRDRVIAA